jgi:hypothetical protein
MEKEKDLRLGGERERNVSGLKHMYTATLYTRMNRSHLTFLK